MGRRHALAHPMTCWRLGVGGLSYSFRFQLFPGAQKNALYNFIRVEAPSVNSKHTEKNRCKRKSAEVIKGE